MLTISCRWSVPVTPSGETTTVAFDPSPHPLDDAVIVFGHGASTDLDHATVTNLAATLRAAGLHTARFNFVYMEAKKGPPDRMPKLMDCYSAVIQSVRERAEPGRLLAGGHSMGGRVASMLAAEGNPLDGLILCAYPLHPSGQPEKLRKDHLPAIQAPTLCFNGTRDELCTRNLMDPIVAPIANWTMHWLEAADHSFKVQKKSGRTNEDILTEVEQTARIWARQHLLSGTR
jgi:predicted alpha/beta-hydrolase family hydrolase